MNTIAAPMRLVVVGAAGRMGRTLIKAIHEHPLTVLAGAIDRPDAAEIGQDAAILAGLAPIGLAVTCDPLPLFAKADGVLDFTTPEATLQFAALAAQARIAHIIGTTGLDDEHLRKIGLAAHHAPIVQSGNMSLGVNLLAALVKQAAAVLGDDWDIEIVEMHHNRKVDAPSGTALLFGEAAAEGRGVKLADVRDSGRDGVTGARKAGDIGFAALRGGTVIGDHQVIFAGSGERIELSHRAEDRGLFAQGALKAALWAHGAKPGLYSMNDVLGIKTS
jgi:4-hydroxy-tetrahydrodipicolinate reductase